MGRYNEFFARVKCTACGAETETGFQADIGVLQWDHFHLGEEVLGRPSSMGHPQIGPAPEMTSNSFWASGLGNCARCGALLWGKVLIREGRFAGVEVSETPLELYGWGYL